MKSSAFSIDLGQDKTMDPCWESDLQEIVCLTPAQHMVGVVKEMMCLQAMSVWQFGLSNGVKGPEIRPNMQTRI